MTFADVEMKLAQYAQWAGNPLRPLDFPGQSIYARAIPDEIDEDALPPLSDDEARAVGNALLALKQHQPQSHRAIEARFFFKMADDEIGRRLQIGRNRVHEIRQRGYAFLQGRFSTCLTINKPIG